MRIPWVSREAYDLAMRQLDQAEARVDKLTDAVTRIRRRESNMPEVPRDAVRQAIEPMPTTLLEYLKTIGNKAIRHENQSQMYRDHARGKSWADIEREVFTPAGESDE